MFHFVRMGEGKILIPPPISSLMHILWGAFFWNSGEEDFYLEDSKLFVLFCFEGNGWMVRAIPCRINLYSEELKIAICYDRKVSFAWVLFWLFESQYWSIIYSIYLVNHIHIFCPILASWSSENTRYSSTNIYWMYS